MNILNIPYFAGGLSHLIPLYALHIKHLKKDTEIKNHFFVSKHTQNFLRAQGISCVPLDYFEDVNESILMLQDSVKTIKYVTEKEREACERVRPVLIIEDTSLTTPLIAEKNNIPRISIQRTGIFRSIDNYFRNKNHVHSLQKGEHTERSLFVSDTISLKTKIFNHSETLFLQQYVKPKAKIIPGIPTIECLPDNIENRESYFYSGPLLVMDKPSKELSIRLEDFLNRNKQKPIVFITTGTIDKTPIEKFIEYFVERGYAVITTCNCDIREPHKQSVFYKKLLPLNYICGISKLVIHQCGSGMYHYPIMNSVPSLTIGTLCYDREDIAQRLQQLGVSGHIPHPEDNLNYWDIFLKLVKRFEENTLVDFNEINRLRLEITETSSNFKIDQVLQYALQ
ncbi:hypothetical protein F5984_25690 [Rudanella paleaurantiibacter]|uniref:Glycosyl transferase n=1 Tax=Rudanella paleaurantiibacter TaxID=2614655 RepID=A0A7J5TS90_9BACT|nr:hypothetical protein [Rudanella paleaurantiibacter]KAB7725716.1 hypothetical protein F5984_25690 [Rudanella paleaurantiibacter]